MPPSPIGQVLGGVEAEAGGRDRRPTGVVGRRASPTRAPRPPRPGRSGRPCGLGQCVRRRRGRRPSARRPWPRGPDRARAAARRSRPWSERRHARDRVDVDQDRAAAPRAGWPGPHRRRCSSRSGPRRLAARCSDRRASSMATCRRRRPLRVRHRRRRRTPTRTPHLGAGGHPAGGQHPVGRRPSCRCDEAVRERNLLGWGLGRVARDEMLSGRRALVCGRVDAGRHVPPCGWHDARSGTDAPASPEGVSAATSFGPREGRQTSIGATPRSRAAAISAKVLCTSACRNRFCTCVRTVLAEMNR